MPAKKWRQPTTCTQVQNVVKAALRKKAFKAEKMETQHNTCTEVLKVIIAILRKKDYKVFRYYSSTLG